MSKKSPSVLDTVVSVVHKKEEHGDTVPKSIINSCKENDKGVKKEYEDFKNKGDARNLKHKVESVEIEEKFDTKCEEDAGDNKISNEYNEREIKECDYNINNEMEIRSNDSIFEFINECGDNDSEKIIIDEDNCELQSKEDDDMTKKGNEKIIKKECEQMNENENKRKAGHDNMTEVVQKKIKCVFPSYVLLKKDCHYDSDGNSHRVLHKVIQENDHDDIQQIRLSVTPVYMKTSNSLNDSETTQNELKVAEKNEEREKIEEDRKKIELKNTSQNELYYKRKKHENKDINSPETVFVDECGIIYTLPNKIGATYIVIRNDINFNIQKFISNKKGNNLKKDEYRGSKNEEYRNLLKEAKRKYYEIGVKNGSTIQLGNLLNKKLNRIEIHDNEENRAGTDSILNMQFPVSLQRKYTIYDENGISYKVYKHLTPRCIVKVHLPSKVNPN